MDQHNAARSGLKREQQLAAKVAELGATLHSKERITDIPEKYSAFGFKFFWNDGSIPEYNIQHVELKGGSKLGTTQEKLFFDLLKIQDNVYKGNLLYIFEGIMETHPCTQLFIHELNKLNRDDVAVMMYSELDEKSLKEVFA